MHHELRVQRLLLGELLALWRAHCSIRLAAVPPAAVKGLGRASSFLDAAHFTALGRTRPDGLPKIEIDEKAGIPGQVLDPPKEAVGKLFGPRARLFCDSQ